MKIDVQWLSEEKQAIYVIFHADWTWEDYEDHRQRAKELARQVPYKIAYISEYDKDAAILPPNAIRNLSRAVENAEPNIGLVVLVLPSRFWRVLLLLFKRLLPNSPLKNSHIVNNRQTALELLEQTVFNDYK